jgi:hypothetical protein
MSGLFPDEPVDLRMNCKYEGSSGDLVVTDRRVFFLRPKGLVHSIKFEEIREVKIESAFLGVQLVIDTSNRQYKYTCTKTEGERVIVAVARRKTQAPSRPIVAQAPDRLLFAQAVDASIRETTVKEVVLVVCPNCGQRNDVGKRKCDNCGASI